MAALAATLAVVWVSLIVWAVRQERAVRRAEGSGTGVATGGEPVVTAAG